MQSTYSRDSTDFVKVKHNFLLKLQEIYAETVMVFSWFLGSQIVTELVALNFKNIGITKIICIYVFYVKNAVFLEIFHTRF